MALDYHKCAQEIADNIGGVTHDWVGSTAGFNTNENVLKNAPDFNIAAMAPPASAAGKKA